MFIVRAFQRWCDNQDELLLRASSSPTSWLASGLTIVCLLALLTLFSPIQGLTGLHFAQSLLLFVPAAGFGLLTVVLLKHLRTAHLAALTLLTSGGMFFFCAGLIAYASPHSKFVFSSLFFFAATIYGQNTRVTPREPFVIIAMWCALGFALLLDTSAATLTAYVMLAIVGPVIAMLVGSWQVQTEQQRKEKLQLRNAVMAQMHQEQATQLHVLQSSMIDILSSNHDLNNLLQTIVLNADLLGREERGELSKEEEQEVLDDIHGAALKIRQITKTIRLQGRELRTNYQAMTQVELKPILEQVLAGLQMSFPGVSWELDIRIERAMASVAKGEETFHRILDNILRNACEGDGTQAASHIEIKILHGEHAETLLLEVLDDGPGFTQEQLALPQARPFETTKREGTGLGLYIVEKWVLASGGRLLRRNNATGRGAHITIELPLWL